MAERDIISEGAPSPRDDVLELAMRINSGRVRTPSFAFSWVQVLATVL